jgi:chromosome segregation ATPase
MADQVNEALSVLNQIEEQSRYFDRQFSAFRNVRKVIEAYQVAEKGLAELDARKASLEESCARLQDRYEAQNADLRRDLLANRHAAEEEMAGIRARVQSLREELVVTEETLVKSKADKEAAIADLDRDIKVREEEIEKLSNDLQALKERHGLAV